MFENGVVVLARPEGVGHPASTIRIEIEGRQAWRRLVRGA
jgi:hypothetical protein